MPTNQQKPQTSGSQQSSKPATTPNQQRDQRPAQGSRDEQNRDRNYGSQN